MKDTMTEEGGIEPETYQLQDNSPDHSSTAAPMAAWREMQSFKKCFKLVLLYDFIFKSSL